MKLNHIHRQTEPRISDGYITIDNEKYKLICKVISPVGAKINLIGGENHQFEIDDVNYIPTITTENTEAGWGQIVITDDCAVKATEFLVEMEIVKRG